MIGDMREDIFNLDELCKEWREELLTTFCEIYEEMSEDEYDSTREIVCTMIIPLLNEMEWLIGEGEVEISYSSKTSSFMMKVTLTNYVIKVTFVNGHDELFFTIFQRNPIKLIKNGFSDVYSVSELIREFV